MITKAYFITNVFNTLTFKPFTVNDWYGFAEPNAWVPLIAYFEFEGDTYNAVLNGNTKIYVNKLTGDFEGGDDWFIVNPREVSLIAARPKP